MSLLRELSVIFACLAVSTLAQQNDLPGLFAPNFDGYDALMKDDNADPKPCCFPKAWQGNITMQSGLASRRGSKFNRGSTMVYVDQDNKRIAGKSAGRGCHRNDTMGFVMLWGANNTANLYAFVVGAQKCFHKKIEHAEFRKQCIPDNSTYEGSFSLGPASGGLQVQSWLFRGASKEDRHRPKAFVGGRVAVVPSGCVPVMVQEHGMIRPRPGPHDSEEIMFEEEDELDSDRRRPGPGRRGRGGSFVASSFFSNMEASVKDPSVFTPPSYCNATIHDTLTFSEDLEYPSVLDRFVTIN
jgi:hypothetical protein